MMDSMSQAVTFNLGPERIVCMTEETTEWLYLLGQEQRIVGISGYTVRPRRARDEKPRVSAFTSAKIDKILALHPDCVFGFSDMQADIAAALIRQGVQVTVFNQRSVGEIYSMMYQVAAMVGQGSLGLEKIKIMQKQLAVIAEAASTLTRRPKIYFEEWDEPHISAIRWVSELMGIAGARTAFPNWQSNPWERIASLPTGRRWCGATPTSSSAPGAARNSGLRKWRRDLAGKT
jgi:iron complex transport system substrate-binding protein